MIDPLEPDSENAPPTKPLSWLEGDMPYSEEFGDFYYSRADGRAECRHVFLGGNGLPQRFSDKQPFVIGELGFGTGLNFVETWSMWEKAAPEAARLEFHSFELRPLRRDDMRRALSAWPDLDDKTAKLVDAWPEQPAGDIRAEFDTGGKTLSLHVHIGSALERLRAARISADAWFLDGFAPSRNPDMWSEELLSTVAGRTAEGGTFATYSAAGWVRRNLQAAGFVVEKRPGHGSKRDMSAGHLSRVSCVQAEPPDADKIL